MVAPGATETAITAEFSYRDEQFRSGRVAQPDDIAGAIWFLCGARAGYITDVTLHLNGETHFGC